MERVVKANKIHTCDHCGGDIQKGEKYITEKVRVPVYDEDEKQTKVDYFLFRYHNRDCGIRLLNCLDWKEVLHNCNNGIHKPAKNIDFESTSEKIYCEWCGIELK